VVDMSLRMLEGELWEYNGVVYSVKGFQHPEGMLIAYPRYDLHRGSKVQDWLRDRYVHRVYWDCIKLYVPVIPLEESTPVTSRCNYRLQVLVDTISSLLEYPEEYIYLAGSSRLLGKYRDVDVVMYGVKSDVIEDLEGLVNRGVLKRVNEWVLVEEYLEKHRGGLSLTDYLRLKKKTILHMDLMGHHVNLRPVVFAKGLHGCVDPVHKASRYTGRVRVTERVVSHTVPSRYLVELENGEEVIMESMREVYAELEEGEYMVLNGRLEERGNGVYLVPDHGWLKPLA